MGRQTHSSPTYPRVPGGAVLVTPSDSARLVYPSVIYVGGTGNVNVKTVNGDTVLFSGVPAGATLPVEVIQVLSTTTTATLMVAVY